MKRLKCDELPPPDPRILQEMLDSRRPPGALGTDQAFLRGSQGGDEVVKRYGPRFANYLERKAKQQGISLAGKKYVSQLATEFADPRALVADTSDVLQRCRELNKSCEGVVNYKAHETPPAPSVGLGADIVERRVNELVKADPGLATKKRQELREAVKEQATPHWKRK